ncbi:MAG: hypothetical protein EAZ95_02650 [Bacteroidetes bacterium]|nr:MAG: hypothetical protein EAZ95_02650 [Bacteroidota bacterium]
MNNIWKATLKTALFSFLILSTSVVVLKDCFAVDAGLNMMSFIIPIHILMIPLLYFIYKAEKNDTSKIKSNS